MKRYDNISIWRAVSCMGVLMAHTFSHAQVRILPKRINIISLGIYGVLFFFIITGFLAYASRDIRENIRVYYLKRIKRIMPMYLTVLLVWLILFSLEERSLEKGWEMLTADFVGGTWTVWVTIVFYILAPLFVRVVNTYVRAVAALLLFCVPRFLFMAYRFKCLDNTWQYMCFCVGGGVMYYAFKEEKERVTVFLLSMLVILMKLSGIKDDYFFYFLVFMIIFMASRYVQLKDGLVAKSIKMIDKYSYHIFLAHPIILFILDDYNWYIQVIFGVIGSFGLAWLAYNGIDRKLYAKSGETG